MPVIFAVQLKRYAIPTVAFALMRAIDENCIVDASVDCALIDDVPTNAHRLLIVPVAVIDDAPALSICPVKVAFPLIKTDGKN